MSPYGADRGHYCAEGYRPNRGDRWYDRGGSGTARAGRQVDTQRVDVLRYGFTAEEGEDFSAAAPWEGQLGGFQCRLADEVLEARPQDTYPDVESATQVLERHLREWEVWSELQEQRRIRFRLSSVEVVDPQAGSRDAAVMAEVAMAAVITGTATVRRVAYPAPPTVTLAVTPLIEELLRWVRDLRAGRQRMLVLAYLSYTHLVYEYGTERAAAKAINVSANVLETLSRLSHKNDPDERRKVAGRDPDPLAETERRWLLTAMPAIARQAALAGAGSSFARLTMADLPSL